MSMFECKIEDFFQSFGDGRKMVLSTSLHDKVTSRMMSVVLMKDTFYFQTDVTLRKYEQLKGNPNVALCADNIQIEGICREIGHPLEHEEFCNLYKKCFLGSFEAYTSLKNERLFAITPTYIEKWEYEKQKPYIEIIDILNKDYRKIEYIGK